MASSFESRIGYFVTCAIPTHVLSDATSADGVSYIRVQRPLDAPFYLVRVLASSGQVRGGYTELLSEEQLSYASPYDKRLEDQTAERILELLHAHSAVIRPAPARAPRVPVPAFEADTTIGVFELPVAEVSEQYAQMSGDAHERLSVQHVLLHLALAAVEQIIARGGQEALETLQERVARLKALSDVQRQTHQRVVRSTIVWRSGGEVWQVRFAAVA